MKTTQRGLLLASLSALAAADFPAPGTTITFWRDAGCNSAASSEAMTTLLLPSSGDDCISGTQSLKWPTVQDDPNTQIAYYTGDGLPASCDLAILQQADIQPGACGTAVEVINGGTTGSCKQGKLPIKGGSALCCGGQGNGCAEVPSVKKARNATEPRSPAKDVTSVKRSGIFDRLNKRDCSFSNSANPYQSRGSQQIVSAQVSCPGGSGDAACSKTISTSRTTGSTNSFGVSDSVTAGTDFFVDIENTISFSYMYSYSSSETVSGSYDISIPAGQTGYITWTPTVSCVDGSFAGDCSWNTGDGTACIPLHVGGGATGDPQGTYAFLQES